MNELPSIPILRPEWACPMRSENVVAKAFLEMDCTIAGKGPFFSKALQDAAVVMQDW